MNTVLVTGGAGYVGSVLVPELLKAGYQVKVLDLCIYGPHVLDSVKNDPKLTLIKADIRNQSILKDTLANCDIVIHLACISNDPSYDLNPELAKSINYDAFQPLVKISKDAGVNRFIYASSSSVYGIKNEAEVTEDLSLEPLTDYSKYKALCEDVLQAEREPGFSIVTIRPSTVCGYAPRLRLDLTVNILTNHALNRGRISVYGGRQKRPNIHIKDMVGLYLHLLQLPPQKIDGGIYNAGYENLSVMRIAELVKDTLSTNVEIDVSPTDDNRSYHVSSNLIKKELGFVARHTIEDAVNDLREAFDSGKVPNSLDNSLYFNIKRMQEINLS